jgi:imidazole glycerol-phosphate synthase subunit HisH
MSKIVIIDYGMGNLRSVYNKLNRYGISALISNKIDEINSADKLILPGVGNFAYGMKNIKDLNLLNVLKHKVNEEKVPILGICLGMQLLTKHSEEGDVEGLGFIDADTKRFSFNGGKKLKVPHIGWNTVTINKTSPLLSDIENEALFYFVHSYYVSCNNTQDVLLSSHYGLDFISGFQKDNIYGTQFHPEKSHSTGIQLIKNFIAL